MTAGPFSGGSSSFAELPSALVDDVLEKTTDIAANLVASFQEVKDKRSERRAQLTESGMVVTESSLGHPPHPTTCATDGSYAIERLLATDLVAAAAVAVEGLTPPSEKRHWDRPRHRTFVAAEPHDPDTSTVLRAVMLGEELRLITKAPHDLLMLDGTMTLPLIYFNQALNKAPAVAGLRCAQEFVSNIQEYLHAYLSILRSKRSDKHFVALPKYSSRREIGRRLGWPAGHDDRGMLTLLLNPGELTEPRELEHPRTSDGRITWHLDTQQLPTDVQGPAKELADEIVTALGPLHVTYYKAQEWLPALRIEMPQSIAANKHRLATVIQGIKHQTVTPSMLEPYPVYLADRTVKALHRGMKGFRQVATQSVSEEYKGDIGDVFFAMHAYRTDTGR